jgi:hypothetical protein
VADIHIDAFCHKQVLDLIRRAAVGGEFEADAGEHDELCVDEEFGGDAGSEALEATQDDNAEIGGFFDKSSNLLERRGCETDGMASLKRRWVSKSTCCIV